jgi:hypothetical protein
MEAIAKLSRSKPKFSLILTIGLHLQEGINRVVARYHERDLKGTIKRFDRTFLKGNLKKLGKRVISR